MDAEINLKINGSPKTVRTNPERAPLDVLREELHLTGPKCGCTRRFMCSVGCLLIVVLTGLLVPQPAVSAQDKLDLDKIPKKVMDSLKARFPKAVIHTWTKEKEGDIVIYDLEFKQEGRKFEADIKEDGTIDNWEKAIEVRHLPAAVKKAVEKKYPKSIPKEIMEITAVKNGKDELEGYEIVLETAHKKKEVEVTVAPDGKIVEDSGDATRK